MFFRKKKNLKKPFFKTFYSFKCDDVCLFYWGVDLYSAPNSRGAQNLFLEQVQIKVPWFDEGFNRKENVYHLFQNNYIFDFYILKIIFDI
jgi:hypothetical protein